MLFENGSSFEVNFASFGVLKQFVSNWISIYGSPLRVNDADCGTVSFDNPALKQA